MFFFTVYLPRYRLPTSPHRYSDGRNSRSPGTCVLRLFRKWCIGCSSFFRLPSLRRMRRATGASLHKVTIQSIFSCSFLLKIKSVQLQMKLHTEKRIAPFVATQIRSHAKAYESRACIFTDCKNARLQHENMNLCGKFILARSAKKFNTFPEKEAHPHFLHQKPSKTQKTGSTSSLFSSRGCASFLHSTPRHKNILP